MDRKSYRYCKYETRRFDGVVTTTSSLEGGKYQYISALNSGKFVRGLIRLNPVTIAKTTFSSISDRAIVTLPDTRYSYVEGAVTANSLTISANGPNWPSRGIVYWNDVAANRALVSAYSRMNSPEFWAGGTFLGELSETIGMLKRPFTGLRKLLRKKKFRDPRRLVNASGDTLLELRYGLRPLIGEVQTIAKMFHARARRDEQRIWSSKGFAKLAPINWTGSGMFGAGELWFPYIDRGTRLETYTSSVLYRRMTGFNATCHQYGLGIQDIPAVAWELTTLSFVVDWFVQVGPWLRAMTPNPSVQILGNSTSRKSFEMSSRVLTGNCEVSGIKGNRTAHRTECRYEALERRVNSALPALPVRNVDSLGFARKVDSLALLWQRLPSAWIKPR